MTFSLESALAMFRLLMYVILSTIRWKDELLYLEDIVILLSTPENTSRTQGCFLLLKYLFVTLKSETCAFLTKEIHLVSHIIWRSSIGASNRTKNAVRDREVLQQQMNQDISYDRVTYSGESL